MIANPTPPPETRLIRSTIALLHNRVVKRDPLTLDELRDLIRTLGVAANLYEPEGDGK